MGYHATCSEEVLQSVGCLICGRFDFLGCSPCCSSPKTSFKLRAHFFACRIGFVSVGGAESSELRRQSADYLHAWKPAGLRGWSFEQPEANHFMAIAGFIDKESKLCVNLKRIVETCEAG